MAGQPSEQQVMAQVPQRDLSPGFQEMLGKIIADPDFRQSMAANPEQALQQAGIQLAPEEAERIRNMSQEDRERLLQQLDTRDSKAWWYVVWHWVSFW
jgi:hypothetical protein